MLWRIKELFDGGGELIRAEAELAANRLKRGLLAAILLVAALAVAILGLGVLLAGLTTALAAQTGWIAALCIVGGILFLIAAVAAWPALNTLQRPFSRGEHDTHPVIRAAESRNQMADAINPSVSKQEAKGLPPPQRRTESINTDLDQLKDAAVEFVSKNPAAVASGAFLALSIIGPFRTIRLLSRGLAVAGLVTTVVDSLNEQKRPDRRPPRPTRPGPIDRDTPRDPPPAPTNRPHIAEPKPHPAGRFVQD